MTIIERKPRKYKRITPEEGARARALWAAGAATLEEIAAEIGVSSRAIQMHLKEHGVVRGSEAEAMAARITREIVTDEFGDREARVEKGKAARAATYRLADQVEQAVATILAGIAEDPSSAFRVSAPLKALDLAAATIERCGKLKIAALGLDSGDNLEPLPEIHIRDLSDADIEAMRAEQEEADA